MSIYFGQVFGIGNKLVSICSYKVCIFITILSHLGDIAQGGQHVSCSCANSSCFKRKKSHTTYENQLYLRSHKAVFNVIKSNSSSSSSSSSDF